MDGIGSIGSLAVFAARVFAPAQAAPVVAEVAPASSAGPALSGDTAMQYQMSVLGKTLYASADQALALLQMLPQPASPTR